MLIPIDKSNLSSHLPEFVSVTMKDEFDVENAEHDKLRQDALDVFQQLFIDTATWGLKKWENIYGITQSEGNYEQRRARIKAKMRGAQLVTPEFMVNLVSDFCVGSKVYLTEQYSEYRFSIIIENGRLINSTDLQNAVNLYKPAHLGVNYILKFNDVFNGNNNDNRLLFAILNIQTGVKKLGIQIPYDIHNKLYVGTLHNTYGTRKIGIPVPTDISDKIYAGIYYVKRGTIYIGGRKYE